MNMGVAPTEVGRDKMVPTVTSSTLLMVTNSSTRGSIQAEPWTVGGQPPMATPQHGIDTLVMTSEYMM